MVVVPHERNSELNRNPAAIAGRGRDGEEVRRAVAAGAGGDRLVQGGPVPFAEPFRNNEIQIGAQSFMRLVSEDALGAAVPVGDQAVRAHQDDCVRGGIDQTAQVMVGDFPGGPVRLHGSSVGLELPVGRRCGPGASGPIRWPPTVARRGPPGGVPPRPPDPPVLEHAWRDGRRSLADSAESGDAREHAWREGPAQRLGRFRGIGPGRSKREVGSGFLAIAPWVRTYVRYY